MVSMSCRWCLATPWFFPWLGETMFFKVMSQEENKEDETWPLQQLGTCPKTGEKMKGRIQHIEMLCLEYLW